MKLLLIEDELALLEQISNYMKNSGHVVENACDGEEGWTLFQENPHTFDCIVSDIKMPKSSGIELLQKIRDKEYEIPVIFISGDSDVNEMTEALRLGAMDFLIKPFPLDLLKMRLAKVESMQPLRHDLRTILPCMKGNIELSVASKTNLILPTVSTLQLLFKWVCQFHRQDYNKISLCLQESISNAIIHGNLDISSSVKEKSWDDFENLIKERENDPEFSRKIVIIILRLSPDRIEFEIEDQGNGFNYKNLPDLDNKLVWLNESGRGLFIIQTLMDQVEWYGKGNHIKLIKYF